MMSILPNSTDTRSQDFVANSRAMEALVEDLRDKLAKVAEGGSAASKARHVARGKLLPRDRVDMLAARWIGQASRPRGSTSPLRGRAAGDVVE